MADFLFLFRGGRPESQDYSPDQMQQHMQKWGDWIKALGEKGVYKGGAPLSLDSKVLRDAIVSDGPYAEAKDAVGGYVIVAAETLDDAAEMAKKCPIFETKGVVEVRPITAM